MGQGRHTMRSKQNNAVSMTQKCQTSLSLLVLGVFAAGDFFDLD